MVKLLSGHDRLSRHAPSKTPQQRRQIYRKAPGDRGPAVNSSLTGVVAGSLDDPRVGAVAAPGVEVLFAGDAGHDRGEDTFPVFRGDKAAGPAARRRTMRTVRLNLTRSGSMPASVAARQIRADRA